MWIQTLCFAVTFVFDLGTALFATLIVARHLDNGNGNSELEPPITSHFLHPQQLCKLLGYDHHLSSKGIVSLFPNIPCIILYFKVQQGLSTCCLVLFLGSRKTYFVIWIYGSKMNCSVCLYVVYNKNSQLTNHLNYKITLWMC